MRRKRIGHHLWREGGRFNGGVVGRRRRVLSGVLSGDVGSRLLLGLRLVAARLSLSHLLVAQVLLLLLSVVLQLERSARDQGCCDEFRD